MLKASWCYVRPSHKDRSGLYLGANEEPRTAAGLIRLLTNYITTRIEKASKNSKKQQKIAKTVLATHSVKSPWWGQQHPVAGSDWLLGVRRHIQPASTSIINYY
jgi:hypothetical protein